MTEPHDLPPRVKRSTTRRDRHRRILAQGHPPCAICGEPIDYEAPFGDPRSFVADHIVPVARGGADTLDNKQPAHFKCNGDKGAWLPDDPTPGEVELVTERAWWLEWQRRLDTQA